MSKKNKKDISVATQEAEIKNNGLEVEAADLNDTLKIKTADKKSAVEIKNIEDSETENNKSEDNKVIDKVIDKNISDKKESETSKETHVTSIKEITPKTKSEEKETEGTKSEEKQTQEKQTGEKTSEKESEENKTHEKTSEKKSEENKTHEKTSEKKSEENKTHEKTAKDKKSEKNSDTKIEKKDSKEDTSVADRAVKKAEEKIKKAEQKKKDEKDAKEAKEKALEEKSEKGIEISIKLKTRHMYEFQMRHTYLSTSGIISVLVSLAAFAYFLMTYQKNEYMMNLLLILASLMFTVIYPFQMFQRSVQLVKLSPILSKALNYTFTAEGILVSQDNDDALLPWEHITKVVETRRLLLVYSSPKNGYILPKVQYKEQCDDVKAMIRKLVNKEECKLQLKGE